MRETMTARTPLSRVALALLLIQGAHVLEHVVQTLQVFALELPRAEARGLFGAVFDFEWVHFFYNGSLVVGLILLASTYSLRERFWSAVPGASRGLFFAAVALQGYHFTEHVVKLGQWLWLGLAPAPGILGQWLDLVPLHLALNALVFLGMAPLLAACALRAGPCDACAGPSAATGIAS